jgi:hypothetical protein
MRRDNSLLSEKNSLLSGKISLLNVQKFPAPAHYKSQINKLYQYSTENYSTKNLKFSLLAGNSPGLHR